MKIKCTQTRHKSLFVLHLSHAVAQNNFRDSVDVLCGICNNMLLFQLWSYDRYQVRGLPAKHMCIMFMPRSSSEDSQLRHTLFNDEILIIFGTVWMCCIFNNILFFSSGAMIDTRSEDSQLNICALCFMPRSYLFLGQCGCAVRYF